MWNILQRNLHDGAIKLLRKEAKSKVNTSLALFDPSFSLPSPKTVSDGPSEKSCCYRNIRRYQKWEREEREEKEDHRSNFTTGHHDRRRWGQIGLYGGIKSIPRIKINEFGTYFLKRNVFIFVWNVLMTFLFLFGKLVNLAPHMSLVQWRSLLFRRHANEGPMMEWTTFFLPPSPRFPLFSPSPPGKNYYDGPQEEAWTGGESFLKLFYFREYLRKARSYLASIPESRCFAWDSENSTYHLPEFGILHLSSFWKLHETFHQRKGAVLRSVIAISRNHYLYALSYYLCEFLFSDKREKGGGGSL